MKLVSKNARMRFHMYKNVNLSLVCHVFKIGSIHRYTYRPRILLLLIRNRPLGLIEHLLFLQQFNYESSKSHPNIPRKIDRGIPQTLFEKRPEL